MHKKLNLNLDFHSGLPIYIQIVNQIQNLLVHKTLKPGDQLPSVEKLASDMGVGRSTVREGLRLLQAKGLVEIRHGIGTFVAAERITHTSGILSGFSETILERGMKPRSEVLQNEIILADVETANKLEIGVGDQVNILKRLRFADEIPMALETSISSQKRFPDLLQQDWNGTTSLYSFIREHYKVIPTKITHVVQAVPAVKAQSKYLLIQSKSPLLLVETIAYDQTGIAIEFGRSYYRADRYEYRVQLN